MIVQPILNVQRLTKTYPTAAGPLTVLHEVWIWVSNFVENPRALALLQQNAPALVPAKYNK